MCLCRDKKIVLWITLDTLLRQDYTFIISSGGSRISGKEVYIYKGSGVRFADFISFFLNIP